MAWRFAPFGEAKFYTWSGRIGPQTVAKMLNSHGLLTYSPALVACALAFGSRMENGNGNFHPSLGHEGHFTSTDRKVVMSTKLTAAFACSAAFLLGACSGSNPAGTSSGSDAVDTPRAAALDAVTLADAASLARANDQYAAAQAAVNAATAAAETAATGSEAARAEARRLIAAARTAIDAAVTAAEAAVTAAADGSAADFGRAARARDRANALRAAQTAVLDRALASLASGGSGSGGGGSGSSAGWSGRAAARVIPRLTEVTVLARIPRKPVDDTNYHDDGAADLPTALTAADLPPVMYEDGKIMMRQGADGSGDRLQARGFPVKVNQRHNHGSSPGWLLYPNLESLTAADTDNDNFFVGLKITPSGLVMDLGQDSTGSAGGGTDLRIKVAGLNSFLYRSTLPATGGSPTNRYDVTLGFGRPRVSHTGNVEHYWTAALMPTIAQAAADAGVLRRGTQILPIGTYYLRLSNYLGADMGLEDPDDPVASAGDDATFYLSYAAYGLFDFVPRVGLNTGANGELNEYPRMFPFHAGYDAFKDEAGMKATDVADANKITSGKFKGRTIAEELLLRDSPTNQSLPPYSTLQAAMLRGDVELTATISGTAANNKISGKIMNLESWDAIRGYWQNYTLVNELTLAETSIRDDGGFNGGINDPGANFKTGGYKGNFYGPLSGLEIGGAWFLNSDVSGSVDKALVGSFGAAHVREDGTRGHVIRTDGN